MAFKIPYKKTAAFPFQKTTRFSQETARRLKHLERELDIDSSQLIRDAVSEYLDRHSLELGLEKESA